MSRTLTVRTVETIQPASTRQEIPDRLLPGLYFVIQPSGAKSWALRYRSAGRTRKHTLGSYPALDLKTARDLGREALRAVAEGRDPGREKALARETQPDTVAAVAKQFVDKHCLRANRPRYAAETQRLLNKHVLPRWKNRLLRDIVRRDVLDLLDAVVEAGTPIEANRALAAFKKMCNWAVGRDIIGASPCAGVKPPSKENERDRVLSDLELAAVWHAADRLGGPFGTLVKLLILTGQRRDEVAGMRWSEIETKAAQWTLPPGRVKNDTAHEVPLGPTTLDILAGLPRIGDTFVLTTTGEGPASGYAKGKRRLDALLPMDMPHWVLHDLRRSFASGMGRLGIALPVIERLLNHKSGSFGGIVGIYQRHDYAGEKWVAMQAWDRHVLGLIRPPAEISRPRSHRPVAPSP